MWRDQEGGEAVKGALVKGAELLAEAWRSIHDPLPCACGIARCECQDAYDVLAATMDRDEALAVLEAVLCGLTAPLVRTVADLSGRSGDEVISFLATSAAGYTGTP
jgi:hypothetical protein